MVLGQQNFTTWCLEGLRVTSCESLDVLELLPLEAPVPQALPFIPDDQGILTTHSLGCAVTVTQG